MVPCTITDAIIVEEDDLASSSDQVVEFENPYAIEEANLALS